LTERGELPAAQRALDRGGTMTRSHGAILCLVAGAALRLAEGRPADALALAKGAGERGGDHLLNPAFAPWRSLAAEALDRLDRSDEAIELAEEELRLARAWGAPATVGRALRTIGQIRRGDGIDTLREAVDVLEESGARLELAKAQAALGGALRRARRPTDARDPLRRALELADACGSPPLADFARAELHASGARPRSDALSGVDSLTASERRVVDLASQGQSNRDIAQALYVTPKTVEVHLTNAYRKLGIRSRRELSGALAPAGQG
jgi:DNA-binding CsgD family transcriptional regulator